MSKESSLRIIVTGLIAQHPWLGGVTWDYLQYPLGLARLGHDVYYFEDSGQWPYTLDGGPTGNEWITYDGTANVEHLAKTMARFGLENKWAYNFPTKSRWYGISGKERQAIIESADLLINVSGTLKRPQDYRRVKRLVYIDSDPAFTQIKLKLARGQKKFHKRVNVHDVFFSFGESFSAAIPDTGHRWRPTRQPIVLDEWHPKRAQRGVYTTVMSWTSYKPLRYRGQTYGQKDIEFKKFAELPRRAPNVEFEIAMNLTQHAEWQTEEDNVSQSNADKVACAERSNPDNLLAASGWHVVDASTVCSGMDSYRDYIESSKAEWSVAKNGYVNGRAGWFSGRSACYLAAGRPVIVQDTGFGGALPVGEGILAFSALDDAVAAISDVEANYSRHARAARAIAECYFDSDKVLQRLIEETFSSGE
jgi:hypothetical protein